PLPPPPPNPAAAPRKPAASAESADATVRIDVRRLDALVNLVGELVLARNRLKTIRPRLRDEHLDRAVTALDGATSRLQSAVMTARMQPVGRVFSRFPKLTRDIARQLQKSVELDVVGADTELDRNLVEALSDPLLHLVRNAIDHGIEPPSVRIEAGKPEQGRVRLSAQQEGDHVAIEVRDDGAGIDPDNIRDSALRKGLIDAEAAARLSTEECLQLIFLPGFSTRAEVSDLSGRGVGMDVVQSKIRELSGEVQIQSEPGRGTRFLIRVPLTLAILPTLLVEIDQDVYALPLVRVVEVLAHHPGEPMWVDTQRVLDLREEPVPLLGLRDWLGLQEAPLADCTNVVLQSGEQRFCLAVDRVRGREEVVIKALPRTLRGLPGYAGASLIGDGRMALILDVDALYRTGVRGAARTL
ncbi:chemotaxis protein CheA, partial [Lysobacter sp. D1-1-M9]|uniref:chemotaxis protein CheA n=2 Tax=Novilysobacter TaxID=3382699 RepID=UPI002FCA93A3